MVTKRVIAATAARKSAGKNYLCSIFQEQLDCHAPHNGKISKVADWNITQTLPLTKQLVLLGKYYPGPNKEESPTV